MTSDESVDAAAAFVARTEGRFDVLVNDPSRLEARFGSPLYGPSKAAVNMLTARFARLLPNIRINVADRA